MDNVEYIQQEYEWSDLPWKKFEKVLYKLQKRIYQASKRGDVKNVRRLQKLLLKSRSAKLVSVRKVTQDNQGSKTAGVDGVKNLSPKDRFKLVDKITLRTKASPVRRVLIPKPGKDEKRPLGIPIMYDRAVQCLTKMALEPEWEAKFEPNSYGFRPGRSCQDGIRAIFLAIKQKSKFVLDADISQCFDRIDHQKLLQKLNTYPSLRRQIRAWLKAGIWQDFKFSETTKGTPQGGVISPLLANIALHGMEERIKKYAETLDIKDYRGKQVGKRDKRSSLSLIRYADDFVILHEDYSVVQSCREIISEWLKDIGLELKPSKTRLTHTLHNVGKEKAGFDFLGFNVRQYKVGKYLSGKNPRGKLLGFKTLIKPSKKSIKTHYKKLADIINSGKSFKQERLIGILNPIIRGWCNYYSKVVSSITFEKLDALTIFKLWKWAVKRHRNKGKKWLKSKYFQSESIYNNKENIFSNKDWIFATTKDGIINDRLRFHKDTKITRHIIVKGEASPFDGDLVYWSSRMGRNPLMPLSKAKLLKIQKGKCNWCGLTFQNEDVIEKDHIIPKSKGGKDYYNNLQLLHRHCHDKKSKIDGSNERQPSKHLSSLKEGIGEKEC
jgi:RNA-directed DNA polymerase